MKPFSVCMSVYKNDKADAFVEAFNSICNQTAPPSEIILVEDGPVPDNLEKEVKRLEQAMSCLRVIRLDHNVGHAGARQIALEAATHELIAVMDSDDIAEPYRFELQLKAFDEHPEVSVIGGLIKEFVETVDNVVGERIVPESDIDIKSYLKKRCPMNLVTVMYRKGDIQRIGGFMDWYCEEDYYLWIRLAQNNYQFYNIQKNLVNVRVGKEMYSRRGGWRYFKSEARLQWYMLCNGVICFPRYAINTMGRFVVQVLMPNKIRGFVFQKLFRK